MWTVPLKSRIRRPIQHVAVTLTLDFAHDLIQRLGVSGSTNSGQLSSIQFILYAMNEPLIYTRKRGVDFAVRRYVSAVYAVVLCLSFCPSATSGIVPKRLDESSWVLAG